MFRCDWLPEHDINIPQKKHAYSFLCLLRFLYPLGKLDHIYWWHRVGSVDSGLENGFTFLATEWLSAEDFTKHVDCADMTSGNIGSNRFLIFVVSFQLLVKLGLFGIGCFWTPKLYKTRNKPRSTLGTFIAVFVNSLIASSWWSSCSFSRDGYRSRRGGWLDYARFCCGMHRPSPFSSSDLRFCSAQRRQLPTSCFFITYYFCFWSNIDIPLDSEKL